MPARMENYRARSIVAPETAHERLNTRHDHSDWPLTAGCWLLKHFRRVKNRPGAPKGKGRFL